MKNSSKRLLGLFLAVLLILAQPMAVLADNTDIVSDIIDHGTVAGAVWSLNSDGTLTISPDPNAADSDKGIVGIKGSDGSINIKWKAANQPWNSNASKIKKLIVEEGITTLPNCLVQNCTNLEEAYLPDSLTYIGGQAFRGCTGLIKVVFSSNCYINKTKPDNADRNFSFALFQGCTSLEEIVLPNGDYYKLIDIAFGGCTNLKRVTIPANVTELYNRSQDGGPFYNCSSLELINYGGTVAQWEAIVTENLKYDKGLANSNITVKCSDGTYVYKDESAGEVTEDSKGEAGNVDWTLDSTGLLTLTAKKDTDGSTGNYKNAAASPLNAVFAKINKIVVNEGVTYLGDYLFRGCAVESVSFPSTLTGIGNSCFRDCKSLKSIVLPNALTKLDSYAFMNCIALESAVINGNLSKIEDRVFSGCSSLKTVTIPSSVTAITYNPTKEGGSFSKCTSLTGVNYGGTIEAWEKLLESDTDSSLKQASIFVSCSDGNYVYGLGKVNYIVGTSGTINWKFDPDTGVLTLTAQPGTDGVGGTYKNANETPFWPYKDQIKSIVVEEGVTVLTYRMFREIGMESITLPETLVSIESDCFRQCANLKEVTLPKSLKNLARTAFFKCTSLTKVVLNGSYTVIEDKTFSGCKALNEIVWNAPIASINNQAFNACAGIRTIHYNGTISQWITMVNTKGITGGEPGTAEDVMMTPADGASSLRKDYITVHCTNGKYVDGRIYIADDLYYTITEGTMVIVGTGEIAGYETGKAPWASSASTITKVILSEGVTAIGKNAFADCKNLTSVCYAGTDAQWEALKAVSAEGNDNLFGAEYSYAYAGYIGENVKWNFDPETGKLTISGTGAMYDYTSRKGLPYFHLLSDVKSVVVEEGVTTIGNYAFQYMTSLTSVTLPKSLRIVGTFAFGYCEKLTEITIPEGVVYIGSKTFSSCKITTLNLPSTLKYIDMKSFDSCTVTDVYYNGTKDAWNLIEISSQAQGNANLLNANIHYAKDKTISDIAEDVASDAWYADSVLYLFNKGLLNIDNKTLSPAQINNLDWVIDMLYIRAGQSGEYASAMDWALKNGIVTDDTAKSLSLNELALILYRTAVYNGQAPAGGDKAALGWLNTQKYSDALYAHESSLDTARKLNRSEIATVMAAYFGSASGTADRNDVILAQIKEIIEQGGDNKMHILSLDAPSGASKAGDATLIIFPNGEVMLLDAMQNSDENLARIKDILDKAGITTIDYMVNSHAHSDHIGNFAEIINYLYGKGGEVKHFYAAYGENYAPTVQKTLLKLLEEKKIDTKTNLREGDVLNIGGVTINIYAPSEVFLTETTGTTDEPVNNTSMAMKFTYGKSTYLTCGDIYRARERYLVSTYGEKIQADVIKLNHHGAYTSNSMDWIHAVDAKIMFAPSDDVGDSILMAAVSAEGRSYYSNGCDGLIHISMDAEANYEVETRFDSNNRSTLVVEHTDPTPDDGNNDNSETGDLTPVIVMMSAAMVALCAAAWILIANRKHFVF